MKSKDLARMSFSQKNSGGFTLIELLIVIAIIGILASVVLGSLNTARTKATDAAIKSNLTNLRGQASIYYDNNTQVYASAGSEFGVSATSTCAISSTTGNLFEDPKMLSGITDAYTKSGGVAFSRCIASETTWAVAVQLKSSDGPAPAGEPDSWCVDSVGASRAYSYATGEDIAFAIDGSDACK